jgi:hypothetical protein
MFRVRPGAATLAVAGQPKGESYLFGTAGKITVPGRPTKRALMRLGRKRTAP